MAYSPSRVSSLKKRYNPLGKLVQDGVDVPVGEDTLHQIGQQRPGDQPYGVTDSTLRGQHGVGQVDGGVGHPPD